MKTNVYLVSTQTSQQGGTNMTAASHNSFFDAPAYYKITPLFFCVWQRSFIDFIEFETRWQTSWWKHEVDTAWTRGQERTQDH